MLSRIFAAAKGTYAIYMLIKGVYANAFAVHRNNAAIFRSMLLSRLYLAVKCMNAKEDLNFLSLEFLRQQMHFQKVPRP